MLKLTDYELTDKGIDTFRGATSSSKLSQDKKGVLGAVYFGGSDYIEDPSVYTERMETRKFPTKRLKFTSPKKLDRIVSTLLREGYIVESLESVDTILNRLDSGPSRRVLETYTRVANEKSVSDAELDSAIEDLLSLHDTVRRTGQLGPNPRDAKLHRDMINELLSAKTRSDKVIALDRAMGLAHVGHSWVLREYPVDETWAIRKGSSEETRNRKSVLLPSQDYIKTAGSIHRVLGKLAGD